MEPDLLEQMVSDIACLREEVWQLRRELEAQRGNELLPDGTVLLADGRIRIRALNYERRAELRAAGTLLDGE
jgi:hypothetical protein